MTPDPSQDSIIRKIQKLFALAQSPNQAEAELAMARAQSLLAQHNLDVALVKGTQVAGGTVEEAREKKRMSRSAQYQWQRDLWACLAQENFCWHSVIEVYDGKRGAGKVSQVRVKRHMILGRESNVIAVQLMGEYLEDTMERILPYANRERMSRAANNWKAGCAETLVRRLREQGNERREQSEAARSAGTDSQALVLRDVYQREYASNYDFKHGDGSYARRLAADAEWEAGAAAREAEALAAELKAEADWIEYLKNESPQDKKKRERTEAKERLKNYRAGLREDQKWDNENWREQQKRDPEARRAGRSAGESIGLMRQVGNTLVPKERRLK